MKVNTTYLNNYSVISFYLHVHTLVVDKVRFYNFSTCKYVLSLHIAQERIGMLMGVGDTKIYPHIDNIIGIYVILTCKMVPHVCLCVGSDVVLHSH